MPVEEVCPVHGEQEGKMDNVKVWTGVLVELAPVRVHVRQRHLSRDIHPVFPFSLARWFLLQRSVQGADWGRGSSCIKAGGSGASRPPLDEW